MCEEKKEMRVEEGGWAAIVCVIILGSCGNSMLPPPGVLPPVIESPQVRYEGTQNAMGTLGSEKAFRRSMEVGRTTRYIDLF